MNWRPVYFQCMKIHWLWSSVDILDSKSPAAAAEYSFVVRLENVWIHVWQKSGKSNLEINALQFDQVHSRRAITARPGGSHRRHSGHEHDHCVVGDRKMWRKASKCNSCFLSRSVVVRVILRSAQRYCSALRPEPEGFEFSIFIWHSVEYWFKN